MHKRTNQWKGPKLNPPSAVWNAGGRADGAPAWPGYDGEAPQGRGGGDGNPKTLAWWADFGGEALGSLRDACQRVPRGYRGEPFSKNMHMSELRGLVDCTGKGVHCSQQPTRHQWQISMLPQSMQNKRTRNRAKLATRKSSGFKKQQPQKSHREDPPHSKQCIGSDAKTHSRSLSSQSAQAGTALGSPTPIETAAEISPCGLRRVFPARRLCLCRCTLAVAALASRGWRACRKSNVRFGFWRAGRHRCRCAFTFSPTVIPRFPKALLLHIDYLLIPIRAGHDGRCRGSPAPPSRWPYLCGMRRPEGAHGLGGGRALKS